MKDALSKRTKKKRVLTYSGGAGSCLLITCEPRRTAIITCFCLGRGAEGLWALKWSDFDFIRYNRDDSEDDGGQGDLRDRKELKPAKPPFRSMKTLLPSLLA